MKKFWKKTEGFTLVELIVVIAILGILAGVGTVGYSGYIKKANMAADQQLVSNIKAAAELAGIAGELPVGTGYIVVTDDKNMPAKASTAELEAAMAATFGADWQTVRLQYNGWDAEMLSHAANGNPEYVAAINKSTYITSVGTEKLLTDVQNCTNALAGFMEKVSGGDLAGGSEILGNVLGEGYDNALKDQTLTKDTLSNAAVFGIADEVKNKEAAVVSAFADGSLLTTGPNLEDGLSSLANWYAAAEAYVTYANDENITNAFNAIDMTGNNAQAIMDSMTNFHVYLWGKENADGSWQNGYYDNNFDKYMSTYSAYVAEDGQAEKDGMAYVAIMSTVNDMSSDDFVKDGMSSSNLFTTEKMHDQLNSYTAASGLAGSLTTDQWNALLGEIEDKSAVVVVVTSSGFAANCVTAPAEAEA